MPSEGKKMTVEHDFRHLSVRFFKDGVLDELRTKVEGRPIYRDVDKVEIKIAGDRLNVFVAPANDVSSVAGQYGKHLTYAELHYKQYEAFKREEEYSVAGTPLSELVFLTEGNRKELRGINVHTAEALAGLEGSALKMLGAGGRILKNKATEFLALAADTAVYSKLNDENAELKARLDALEKAVVVTSNVTEFPVNDSHFAAWDSETIRCWIDEQGGAKPHHNCSRTKLIKLADALNEELALSKVI
jgi:hypothetical protein